MNKEDDDLTEDRDKWKKRAIIAEEQLAISKKLHAQKCDAHMELTTAMESIKRHFGEKPLDNRA